MSNLLTDITEALDNAGRIAQAAKDADLNGTYHISFEGTNQQGLAVMAFYNYVTNPSATLRAVKADKRVLKRHLPTIQDGSHWFSCSGCRIAWPCEEIVDLADRYGVAAAKS